MPPDDHSLIPVKRTDLARRSELGNPILVKMTRDLLVKAQTQLATDEAVVRFKCPNLEASIRAELKKPDEPITRKDLASLVKFSANSKAITNLSGLEYATGLTKLCLEDNQITDISPLAEMTNLTELWLWHNQITDDQKHLLRQAIPTCRIRF